jgi:hypothetical protein
MAANEGSPPVDHDEELGLFRPLRRQVFLRHQRRLDVPDDRVEIHAVDRRVADGIADDRAAHLAPFPKTWSSGWQEPSAARRRR